VCSAHGRDDAQSTYFSGQIFELHDQHTLSIFT